MTREEAKKEALLLPLYDKDDCESVCELLDMIYDNFEATIEAQNIIIKDKSDFMDTMAQPKTCDGCEYYDQDMYHPECEGCKRHEDILDYYKPMVQL